MHVSELQPQLAKRTRYLKEVEAAKKNRRLLNTGKKIEVGDMVTVLNPTPENKLDQRRKGPYRVKGVDKSGVVTLENLEDGEWIELDRRYAYQHVFPTAATVFDDIHEFEKILDRRGEEGAYQYLVKWRRTPDATWEEASQFLDKRPLIRFDEEMARKTRGQRRVPDESPQPAARAIQREHPRANKDGAQQQLGTGNRTLPQRDKRGARKNAPRPAGP